MKIALKNYVSFFFLLLFLIPLVEKELHALEHANDSHCTATDKHFHEQEHSCGICDYSLPCSSHLSDPTFQFVVGFSYFQFSALTENSTVIEVIYDKPARAPPIV